MTDMTDFYSDPFSVPVPMRTSKVAPIKPGAARGADYYAQAAKNAVAQGQKDANAALANEGEALSVKSWLMSTNPNSDAPGQMSLLTKLLLGGLLLGAVYIYFNRKKNR